MSEDAAKCEVFSVDSRDWPTERLAVSKEIHLSTELGLRIYLVHVGYYPRADGSYFPMLMLRFNFSWGISAAGAHFGFVLRRGDDVLALTSVERKTVGPITDMIGLDEVGVTSVMLALATHDDLTAELHGPDGVNIDFPIPPDTKFYPLLRSIFLEVGKLQNLQY